MDWVKEHWVETTFVLVTIIGTVVILAWSNENCRRKYEFAQTRQDTLLVAQRCTMPTAKEER